MGAPKYRQRVFRPFVGVDGEGGDIDGRHEYLLLRAGQFALETGRPLRSWECLEFLANLPVGAEYVSYFFDYDVTMILRDLPEERIKRILDKESRQGSFGFLPVDIGDYQVDYMPHAEFKVRKKGGHWITVSDVGRFYARAFIVAIDEWDIGTPDQRTLIKANKDLRSSFGAVTPETRFYNQLEVDLLADLMTKFRDVCYGLGYIPTRWQGPGRLAAAVLKAHGIPKREELSLPDALWAMANAAYYGGRFETTAVGPVAGPVYQYDINSAYPAAMLQLPCLVHGTWKRVKKLPADGIWLADIEFEGSGILGAFPVRTDNGSIHFPHMGSGVYWSPEIQLALKLGWKVHTRNAYLYQRRCECIPFSWVAGLYKARRELGKSAKGRVLKLAMNSLYGKMAQSIGKAPWGNPIWAGLITSITRAQLLDMAYDTLNPYDVLMLATDGLFTTGLREVTPDEELGGWDLEIHHEGMFVVQPGLYFTAEDSKPKTRGVPMKKVMERRDEFLVRFGEWEDSGFEEWPGVRIPVKAFLGLRLAMHRGILDRAGQWEDVPDGGKLITFDYRTKRVPGSMTPVGTHYATVPYSGGPLLRSVPYSRMIGGNIERGYERLLEDELPDWMD